MKQVAPLRYDVIFKKAFSHPNIFTALVKDFLGIQLKIDEVENDKAFVPSVGNVATKFDLFAEDKQNRVIVEVQHAHYGDSYERFMYYQCSAMVQTIISSSNYRFPVTVITLVFFTGKKTPSPDSGIIVHDFEPRDLVTGQLLENIYPHKHQLIFVFTNDSTHENTPSSYREWMQAIDDSLDGEVDEEKYTNPSIQALFEVIEKDKITPEERARMKDEYNEEHAKKQAIREEKEKIARNFKAFGTLTDEQIASATGLSLEIVKAL
ncbi:hypothetical protein BGP_5871 [Beggiatoa sp. PS]|nr:hypothetical protein BGP_5871 [Beggiatoa sp. PS]